MTTFVSEETACPICNHKITVKHIMSTNTFGGQATDFRTHAAGFDPLHIVMAMCSECGYSDFSHYFSNPRPLSGDLKRLIRETVKPVATDDMKSSTKYVYAARIAELRQAANDEIANLYLQAAWCCADENDSISEKDNRRLAINYFQKALSAAQISPENQPVITYLIGELYRRIGETDTAQDYYEKVMAMQDLSDKLDWLKPLAEQQRDNPSDYFPRK